MSYWNRKAANIQDPPIVAFPDGIRTPHSISLTRWNQLLSLLLTAFSL